MSQASKKVIFIIFGWLVLLTLLDLATVSLGLPKSAVTSFLVASAFAKIFLIALYFMDLKFEHPLTWLLPAIPVILGVVFILALFPDIVFHMTLKM